MPHTPSLPETLSVLRRRSRALSGGPGRRAAALGRVGEIWESRLTNKWTPPEGSPFPWAQVRRSLAALLPGVREATGNLAQGEAVTDAPVVGLVLAGNTPLLAWPALFYAVLAGCTVFAKMSRDETLWPRLFVEALAEADPEVAALIHLDTWPGADPRTTELVQTADAVLVYGSDATIATVRAATPPGTPFYGFGHAISIGLTVGDDGAAKGSANGFAQDTLMYDQQGCLSPQAVFCSGGHTASLMGLEFLPEALALQAEHLEVPPVTDPAIARRIREARDLALFDGFQVRGDDQLRWTVAYATRPVPLPEPVTHGFLYVIPLDDAGAIPERLVTVPGVFRSRVSSVGIGGIVTPEMETALRAEGVTRICPAGTMQTPPLDWKNGGVDLYAELRKLTTGS